MPAFHAKDFEVFTIEGLEPRMEALKEQIRPKLEAAGEALSPHLSKLTGEEMYVHVAKHARRTVHPPDETWVAWSSHKRGYKSHPHFQIGLRQNSLFAMFALIYEYPHKPRFAMNLMEQLDTTVLNLPSDFVISQDHTRPEVQSIEQLGKEGVQNVLKRLREVKKAEFLCGRVYDWNDPTLHDGNVLAKEIEKTFSALEPLYRLSILTR